MPRRARLLLATVLGTTLLLGGCSSGTSDDEVEDGPLPGERLGGHRDVRVDVGPGGAASAAPAGGVALRRTPGEAGHQAGRGPGEHRAAGRTGPTGKGGAGGHGADSSVPDVR